MPSAIKVNTVSVNQLFTAFWATIVVGNWPLTIKVNFCHFSRRERKYGVFKILLFTHENVAGLILAKK